MFVKCFVDSCFVANTSGYCWQQGTAKEVLGTTFGRAFGCGKCTSIVFYFISDIVTLSLLIILLL